MIDSYDVVVIGAGAAGLFAGGTAASRGLKVAIVEKNKQPAKKLMITGKGRCNVTNACDLQVFLRATRRNSKFLYSAYNAFDSQDAMDFFERYGVPLKVERGARVFPVSDSAADICGALVKYALNMGCKIIHGTVKNILIENSSVSGVALSSGDKISASSVIVTTGGKSYPGTGSTGDGYRIAESIGHTITDIVPSLVPFVTADKFVPELQGLSLRNVKFTVSDKHTGKDVFSEQGEMLFTHFGISGPLVLSASSHINDMQKNRYIASIDLKPALDMNTLDSRLLRDFSLMQNRDFGNALDKLLPNKLIPVIIRRSGISPTIKVHSITKEMRKTLCELIKNFSLEIVDFRPINEAIITSGGVSVNEISPKTMESKLVKGVFFAGEVLDVDAYTGGFNLQIAWSTAYAAGNHVMEEL